MFFMSKLFITFVDQFANIYIYIYICFLLEMAWNKFGYELFENFTYTLALNDLYNYLHVLNIWEVKITTKNQIRSLDKLSKLQNKVYITK